MIKEITTFLRCLRNFYLKLNYIMEVSPIPLGVGGTTSEKIIRKKQRQKILDRNIKLRRKEKKRQLIEQIKKERLENSLIFNNN